MRTAFLDRDGVINRKPPEGDYVKSWEEFEFLPGVHEAIRLLKHHGFRAIVISNQRGVSLRRLRLQDLCMIHDRMETELEAAGGGLDAVYYCPHNYDSCLCRKPEIGLFLQAQRDFPDIHFASTFVVGDSAADMEAAARVGCKKVLIGTGTAHMAGLFSAKGIQVDFFADSLLDAVKDCLLRQ